MFNAASLSPRVAGFNRGTQAAWWRPGDVKCQHLTQVLAERRHLLLEVAAAKTRACWIMLSGFGFFAAGVIRFIRAVFDEMTNAAGTARRPAPWQRPDSRSPAPSRPSLRGSAAEARRWPGSSPPKPGATGEPRPPAVRSLPCSGVPRALHLAQLLLQFRDLVAQACGELEL